MTNEEAIKSMRNLDDIISITESEHESVKTAISALEHNSLLVEHISNLQNENTDFFNKLVESEKENTKLKSEIEQLKIDYKDEVNMVNEYTEIMVSQRKEIEQLKSELEQSEITRNKQISVLIQEIKQLEARIEADNVKKDFKEFCDKRDKEESKFREVK